jgi:mannose/fructose/N-acetylgalactosamine-specific phosphotransferase system component IIC
MKKKILLIILIVLVILSLSMRFLMKNPDTEILDFLNGMMIGVGIAVLLSFLPKKKSI